MIYTKDGSADLFSITGHNQLSSTWNIDPPIVPGVSLTWWLQVHKTGKYEISTGKVHKHVSILQLDFV